MADFNLKRSDEILQSPIFNLQEEFRRLIQRGVDSFDLSYDSSDSDDDSDSYRGQIPVVNGVTDFSIIIDALPSSAIESANEIVKRMVSVEDCCNVYSACRREFVEESLSRLRWKNLSSEQLHKLPCLELDDEIKRWCKTLNFSLRILFPSERWLCDRVFNGFDMVSDFAFMEICRSSVIQLLNFADGVAISSRAPERLFKLVDVYETLRDLIPEFEILFSDQYCAFLRNQAVMIWRRVGEAIRGTFMVLENLIERDPAKVPVPGGGVHPITRYVMNYLRVACSSQQTLEQVFEERRERGIGSLLVQVERIMELLECNLEAKSMLYSDCALISMFMMNNGRYIVKKLKDNELGFLLGEDWIRKHNVKIKQFHDNYLRSSWNKVVGVLKSENEGLNPRPLKERFRMFNSYFEEVLKVQSLWVVFDDQFKEELKMSVSRNLLPAYRNFIWRFQSSLEDGRNPEKHIKYSVEDVEARINNELFRGDNAGRR